MAKTPDTYLKKPETVVAVQWTGDNLAEVEAFAADKARVKLKARHPGTWFSLLITTLDGDAVVDVDDWVIRRPDGEFLVKSDAVFRAEYGLAP